MLSTTHCQILKLKGRKNADISRSTLFWFTENLQQQKTLKPCWAGSGTGSRGDVFVVRTSKPVENLWKKWVIFIALRFRYTFYRPQTKRLRARKIGLQYKIRKGRKQIWARFSNPWNSNGIEWNRLILLTWSRILMYLPNTVGKRHKKAFKFIFGDRNLRLLESAFVRCAPQHMVTEMT